MIDRRTLQNPLLYNKLVRMVQAVDPNFDPENIDRNLEYGEAKGQLARKHNITLGRGFDPMKEFKQSLFDTGIKHPKVQRFVMRQEPPARKSELDELAYILGNRPARNWKLDIARKAKKAKSVKQYNRAPNRYDIPGLDTPGSVFDVDWFG